MVLDRKIDWFLTVYPKSLSFVVHCLETMCNFYDYVIRHIQILH